MKVVALVSGGKDSCYAMIRCIDYGHEIIALANLLPLDDSVDELDSFMYQTVGHQIVVAYSHCMGLPLFRRRICGKSRAQNLRYSHTEGDEVEDLFLLIKEVKEHFPELGGVSSGAIASDYQRMRVENVCSRLGIVSLAYLWKQDQAWLLEQMIAAGIQAILVKVAAMGLNPHKHLGKTLAEMLPHLKQLHCSCGVNVCGEGGEYESLTLDCPLFKNCRIILDKYEIVLHSPDDIAPVGVLHPLEFHLESKAHDSVLSEWVESQELEGIHYVLTKAATSQVTMPLMYADLYGKGKHPLCLVSRRVVDSFLVLTCWTRPIAGACGTDNELDLILTSLSQELIDDGLTWGNVLYVHLYINDMAAFTSVNKTYMRHISEELCVEGVPSRSTVGLPLSKSGLGSVMVEVLMAREMSKRVLHVQSISCWAPSSIGPYSQANLHNGVMYMAGQLGLDPPTMVLVPGGAAAQMERALENCEAVAQAFSVTLAHSAISILIYCTPELGWYERAQMEMVLDNFVRTEDDRFSYKPPILFIEVPALPKGALVEVEPFLFVDNDCNSNDSRLCVNFVRLCGASIAPKHLSRAFFSISKEEHIGATHVLLAELEVSLLSSLQTFADLLADASLCWQHVLALRILFVAEMIPMGMVSEAWKKARARYAGEDASTVCKTVGLASLEPFFLPILRTGQNSHMEDLVTLDMIALCPKTFVFAHNC